MHKTYLLGILFVPGKGQLKFTAHLEEKQQVELQVELIRMHDLDILDLDQGGS